MATTIKTMLAFSAVSMLAFSANAMDLKSVVQQRAIEVEQDVYSTDPSLEEFNSTRDIRISQQLMQQDIIELEVIEIPAASMPIPVADYSTDVVNHPYAGLPEAELLDIIDKLREQLNTCQKP